MPIDKYIITYDKRHISRMEGTPSLEDMALSLARTPMYAGQTDDFYSVAHHCMMTSTLMADHKIFGLLHESEVTVVGDCPGPLKDPSQKRYERQLRRAIYKELGLHHPSHELWLVVERADNLELAASSRVCGLPNSEEFWENTTAVMEAMTLVKEFLYEYPPEKQLRRGSPLQKAFCSTARDLIDIELSVQAELSPPEEELSPDQSEK